MFDPYWITDGVNDVLDTDTQQICGRKVTIFSEGRKARAGRDAYKDKTHHGNELDALRWRMSRYMICRPLSVSCQRPASGGRHTVDYPLSAERPMAAERSWK